MAKRSSLLFAVALIAALVTIVVPPAQEVRAEDEGKNIPPTMLILDASGSMKTPDADGQTRLAAAKDAAQMFSVAVPSDAELGFMVYGTEVGNSPEEREAGCKDVKTLLPVEKGNVTKIPAEVGKVEASGHTPMGPALKQAAKELPEDGERSIVLVSDGEDTCAPPPVCEVAKDLKKEGIDLTINTVGFLVDSKARKELECIAEAGGGEYMDAKDTVSLADSMKRLTTRTAQTTETEAEEISGGDDYSSAAEVPADVETFSTNLREKSDSDRADEDGAEYFSTPIAEGERLALSVATMPPPSQGDGLGKSNFTLKLDVEESNCFLDSSGDTGIIDSNGPFFSSYTTKRAGEDCPAGDFKFKVVRKSGPYEGQEIPAEVSIKRFANEDLNGVPEPFEEESFSHEDSLQATEDVETVKPGAWFHNATELKADGKSTVKADIVPGETHVYKINAEYGQKLRGGMKLVAAPDKELARISELQVQTLNSVRQAASLQESQAVNSATEGQSVAFGHAARLNYRNMVGDGEEQPGDVAARKSWLDGDQYIVVFFNNSWGGGEPRDLSEEKNEAATYELTTELTGEKIPGPKFSEASHPQDGDDEGNSKQGAESEEKDSKDSEESDSSSNLIWYSVIVGMLLALGGGGVALAYSRKR
ncbi:MULTISPECIES: VWA domain-containing protein [unclassified Corynebacterium]|uniref:vWA domain-containing protein n=1 Tax=unclassified Corynebacterium TaxID=2624378 RepID=UPI001EF59DEA|nr:MULTISPECIES: VWA domain-containing protein [unclassified Corynebacterium]MCG7259366.1 VWA domain-containing protein [Corynebacterium sp. ACRQK]MCG7263679.1 VWA domain-containing protein [Corynebacterium sp. ACRQL]